MIGNTDYNYPTKVLRCGSQPVFIQSLCGSRRLCTNLHGPLANRPLFH